MNIIIKRFLAFFLSFSIIFCSVTSANAATSIGGWTALDTITAGATNTINAVKGAGATGMRSAVAVAPSVVKVGKHLIKGGGAAALLIAVPQLIGDGVDWVLDPANNGITYTDTTGVGSNSPTKYDQYIYTSNAHSYTSSSALGACQQEAVFYKRTDASVTINSNGTTWSCTGAKDGVVGGITGISRKNNPIYDSSAGSNPDNKKTIPIDRVAAKVIANAEAGDIPSQEAVKATALEGFEAGDYDAALESAAIPDSTVDAGNPDVPADPVDPTKPYDDTGIKSLLKSILSSIAGVLSSITSLSDFFQSEAPQEDKNTELDITVPDVMPVDTDINFGGSCPANFEVNSSIFGNPINITLLDTSKFCGFLSTFVKFPVYAVSSLYALYILGGRKDV